MTLDEMIALARSVFVANFADGDDGGTLMTCPIKWLADEVAEIMGTWAFDLDGFAT